MKPLLPCSINEHLRCGDLQAKGKPERFPGQEENQCLGGREQEKHGEGEHNNDDQADYGECDHLATGKLPKECGPMPPEDFLRFRGCPCRIYRTIVLNAGFCLEVLFVCRLGSP
jgi:hypothetical protein